jgi:hypothetical protein
MPAHKRDFGDSPSRKGDFTRASKISSDSEENDHLLNGILKVGANLKRAPFFSYQRGGEFEGFTIGNIK